MSHDSHVIPLASIRLDGGTQARASLNEETVSEYAAAMATVVLPAAIVYYDGTAYWLADGFHRVAAARRIGATEIQGAVTRGQR